MAAVVLQGAARKGSARVDSSDRIGGKAVFARASGGGIRLASLAASLDCRFRGSSWSCAFHLTLSLWFAFDTRFLESARAGCLIVLQERRAVNLS